MSQRTLESSAAPAVKFPRRLADPRTFFGGNGLGLRLLGTPAAFGVWGWVVPLLAMAVGGVLRFVRLAEPATLAFDETYYVKDAYSYLVSGYERVWPENANDSFNAGNPAVLESGPEYVVHPPVGKWMIAFGMMIFGPENPFGWRFGAALTGTLAVLLLALVAQQLFKSVTLGGIAGLLAAVDNHLLVMSRTSLLDIFLMFWLLAAFAALLLDRTDGRRRLARKIAALAGPQGAVPAAGLLYGPWLWWRPWRLAAGLCLGLAVGTKWSALGFVAVFGLLTVLWDMSARRTAGVRHWLPGGLVRDGVAAFCLIVPLAAGTYLASWTGWFLSSDAYNRQWAASHPAPGWGWLPDPLRSLAEYHRSAYTFHQGLSSSHPYESSAWSWLFLGRPTSFYYKASEEGAPGCSVDSCVATVTAVGNPVIWWSAALSLLVVLFFWAGRRDWRAGAVLSGLAAGYLPWFAYPERTMFFFYAVSFVPFLILGLTFVLGLILGPRDAPAWRRRQGILAVGSFLVLVLLVSAFFYPVSTAEVIPSGQLRLRMWMPSWI